MAVAQKPEEYLAHRWCSIKWANEGMNTGRLYRANQGRFIKAGAFDQNRERFLEFQKWNKKGVLALTMCEQYYNGLLTKGLNSENSPGNSLEESDLESHEWDKAAIYNSYLLLHINQPRCSALEKKKKSNFMVEKPGKHSFNQVSSITSSVSSSGSQDKNNHFCRILRNP